MKLRFECGKNWKKREDEDFIIRRLGWKATGSGGDDNGYWLEYEK